MPPCMFWCMFRFTRNALLLEELPYVLTVAQHSQRAAAARKKPRAAHPRPKLDTLTTKKHESTWFNEPGALAPALSTRAPASRKTYKRGSVRKSTMPRIRARPTQTIQPCFYTGSREKNCRNKVSPSPPGHTIPPTRVSPHPLYCTTSNNMYIGGAYFYES